MVSIATYIYVPVHEVFITLLFNVYNEKYYYGNMTIYMYILRVYIIL